MKRRKLTDAMIKDIAERYPELRKADWKKTRAFILKQQAESDAQVNATMRKLAGRSSKLGSP